MYLCDEDDLSETKSFGSVESMAEFRDRKKLEGEKFARRVLNHGD